MGVCIIMHKMTNFGQKHKMVTKVWFKGRCVKHMMVVTKVWFKGRCVKKFDYFWLDHFLSPNKCFFLATADFFRLEAWLCSGITRGVMTNLFINKVSNEALESDQSSVQLSDPSLTVGTPTIVPPRLVIVKMHPLCSGSSDEEGKEVPEMRTPRDENPQR